MADTWWNCSVMVLTAMTFTTLFTGASSQCNGGDRLSAASSWGILRYPIFGSYPNKQDCRWVIQAKPGEVIQLHDLDMDLEVGSNHCVDYIEIYDGDVGDSVVRTKMCTREYFTFYSSGDLMTITFHSDAFTRRSGFRFEYRSLPASQVPSNFRWPSSASSQCNDSGHLSATSNWTILRHPIFGPYPNKQDCRWVIQAKPGEVIQLHDLDMYLERRRNLCKDYVIIYDGDVGDSVVRTKMCTRENFTFYSSGDLMTITFHSDGFTRRSGFRFEYRSLPASQVPSNFRWPSNNSSSRDIFGTDLDIPVLWILLGIVATIFITIMIMSLCEQPAQASAAPYRRDPARPSNQGPMIVTPSAPSLAGAPPSYEHAVVRNPGGPQGGGVLPSETRLVPTAPPSYDDVMMMSGNATQPNPE